MLAFGQLETNDLSHGDTISLLHILGLDLYIFIGIAYFDKLSVVKSEFYTY